MSGFEWLLFFSNQYEPGEFFFMPLGGARGQSVPILDWVFANEHTGLWKFLGGKKWSLKKNIHWAKRNVEHVFHLSVFPG